MADNLILDSAATEASLKRQQEQKQDITQNLPADWGKQLEEDNLNRQFAAHQEKENRRAMFQQDRESAKQERIAKQQAEAAERQRIAAQKQATQNKINADIEKVKMKQLAREDAEKAKQFEKMQRENEKRIKAEATRQEQLRNPKLTNAQRIRIRQESEKDRREENARIEKMNRMINKQKEMPGPRMRIKEGGGMVAGAINKTIGKAGTVADLGITSLFGKPVAAFTENKNQGIAGKTLRQESRQLSRAVKGHAKYPITGPKPRAPPGMGGFTMNVNPNFMQNLLGQNAAPAKGKKGMPAQTAQDPMARLNDLLRRM